MLSDKTGALGWGLLLGDKLGISQLLVSVCLVHHLFILFCPSFFLVLSPIPVVQDCVVLSWLLG